MRETLTLPPEILELDALPSSVDGDGNDEDEDDEDEEEEEHRHNEDEDDEEEEEEPLWTAPAHRLGPTGWSYR